MSLQQIPVRVDDASSYSIGSLRALLGEIASRLEQFVRDGKTASIDLNGLPFAPGEYEQLRQLLGQGEVTARIEAVGPSEVVETRYSGVWWVTHYNVEGDIVADLLEIAAIPEILMSQPADAETGLALLRAQLADEVPQ